MDYKKIFEKIDSFIFSTCMLAISISGIVAACASLGSTVNYVNVVMLVIFLISTIFISIYKIFLGTIIRKEMEK